MKSIFDPVCESAATMSKLERYRKLKGWSRLYLAKKSGIAESTIRSYEAQRSKINGAAVVRVAALAQVLECNISDLVEDESAAGFLRSREHSNSSF